MTPPRMDELAQLDVAVDTAPDDIARLYKRAQFFSEQTDCFARAVDDCRRALQISWSRTKESERAHPLDKALRFAHFSWKSIQRTPEHPQTKLRQAQIVAAWEWAMERSPEIARWHHDHPGDTKEVLIFAAQLDISALKARDASPQELRFWALTLAFAQDNHVAVAVYALALSREIAAGVWQGGAPACERRSRRARLARYQQLAWLHLAIESAPDDPRWLLKRGWRFRGQNYRAAISDLTRAIALSPDDPRGYETRAKVMLSVGDHWWNNAPDSRMPAADHLRALRLRIARGQIAGTAENLAAQGDQLIPRFPHENDRARQRAHAFYSLAIELAPDNAAYYLARARTLDTLSEVEAELNETISEVASCGAHPDYLRALALDETSQLARAKIIAHWSRELQRETAHEQMEALLNAHQSLADAGISAALAKAIVAEVERALAA